MFNYTSVELTDWLCQTQYSVNYFLIALVWIKGLIENYYKFAAENDPKWCELARSSTFISRWFN
jgi:hypothetical protein